jgi:3-oxoacyl-[acyl-carrier-protein] synthase-3
MPALRDITVAFGETTVSNEELRSQFPDADIDRLASKTGIVCRRIAGISQSAADIATMACRELLGRNPSSDIDGLIYVTQSPEFFLPSTACILHERLGLAKKTACFDLNLGCSGYVYGLAVASGLIASKAASRILLVTSDTYSKYLDPANLQTRILFGDGASASVLDASSDSIGPFDLYSDGGGASLLRCPDAPIRSSTSGLSLQNGSCQQSLFMDGAGIFTFTLREVPRSVEAFLRTNNRSFAAYDHVVFHQANQFVIDQLASRMAIPAEKVVRRYSDIGNTVSTSIPAAIHGVKAVGSEPKRWLLIGFGVGLSWSICEITY